MSEVQKMKMTKEDASKHDTEKQEIENTYVCLTWAATEKIPAEQKTEQQAVQRAVQRPAQHRNSN